MPETELETQEVEESQGGEAQATEAIPAAVPPVQKRPTVAGLKKELNELRQDMNRDVLEWLGQLDVRLEDVEKRTAQHNEALLGDVKTRLDIMEGCEQKTIVEVADDVLRRVEALETATGAIVDALRSHIKDAEELPPAATAAAGFAAAPVQPAEPVHIGLVTQTVAPKCQTMTDVLMICRALQEDPNLTDEERNLILDVATKAAGVTMTQGLQIRAGVKNVGA